jgi:tetratricopeptide (TPR) repeat protein
MSTGDAAPPAENEQITASPPETGANVTAGLPGERIELPPRAASSPVERVDPRRGRFLDGILCLLLLLLAFLCASFKARNTDFFQSLATGRLLAQGGYSFGADPYSFASKGTWVNQSWLYGLGTYALYRIDPSGVALVALKALFVVALAWLMLCAGVTRGEKRWVPILCTTIGVLALSPRLVLQSSILSMLLLGVTIFLLIRSSEKPGRLWLLPLVCLLWVNLDAWFVLGPITVACFFVGKRVGAKLGKEPASMPGETPARLGLVLLACLVACLCNPHHVHAFTSLPIGLVQWGGMDTFKADNSFRSFFLSPWLDLRLYFRDNIGMSVAGVSYFALLALSLASFAFLGFYRPASLRMSRLFVWLFFVVLSGLQIRAIPFFAIVAAPLAALNFFDLVRLPGDATARSRRIWDAWAMPGRVFTFLGMLGLCLASISGNVQAKPHFRREVGWGVEVDPGLAGAAKQIAAWRADGTVRAGQNWMTLTPDIVNYLAWFAPGEKGFVDQRLSLFTEAGPAFIALRRSLAGEDGQEPGKPSAAAWRKICRDWGAEFLVIHNPDSTRPTNMLGHLYSNPKEFVPTFAEGGTAIFAWRDPDITDATPLDSRLVLDFTNRAFGKDAETAPESPTAPIPYQWWHPFLRAEAAPPAELGLALQYSTRFEALTTQVQNDHNRAWFGTAGASFVGVGLTPYGPLSGCLVFPMKMGLFSTYINRLDSGPPDSLYLAIRACRRALAKNPEDIISHLALAEVYSRLNTSTRERSRTMKQSQAGPDQPFFPHASMIRQTQIAAALQSVLKSDPPKERAQMAHLLLVRVLNDPQFFESRVLHLKKFLELSKELKQIPINSREGFEEAIKSLEAEVKKADRQLKNKLDQYEVNAASKRGENAVLEKVRIAMDNGLSEKALNLLIEGKTGRTQIAALLLGLGRIDDADQILTPQPDQEATFDPRTFGMHPLGVPAYEWFQVQKCAAAGDYVEADRWLDKAMKLLSRDRAFVEVLDHFDGMSRTIFEQDVQQFHARIRLSSVVQEANLCTIRAWLALERGSVEKAITRSREAMAFGDQFGPDPRIYQLFVSRPLAELVRELAGDVSR